MANILTAVLPFAIGYVLNKKIDDNRKKDVPTITFEAVTGLTSIATVSKGNGVYEVTVVTSATTAQFKCTTKAFVVPIVTPVGASKDVSVVAASYSATGLTWSIDSAAASETHTYLISVN